jgi:hypothetical protein
MESTLNWFLLVAWSAIGLALQGPGLWAGGPDGGEVSELDRLRSRVPAGWLEDTPDGAQGYKLYRLGPVEDDKYDALVTVRFLGRKQAGTAADYVKSWKGMFFPPQGQAMAEAAEVRDLTVKGATATYLDVHGDYKGIPGNPNTPREHFRLLGLYLETPQGAYVVTMLGPNDTVGFYRKEFERWLKAADELNHGK